MDNEEAILRSSISHRLRWCHGQVGSDYCMLKGKQYFQEPQQALHFEKHDCIATIYSLKSLTALLPFTF